MGGCRVRYVTLRLYIEHLLLQAVKPNSLLRAVTTGSLWKSLQHLLHTIRIHIYYRYIAYFKTVIRIQYFRHFVPPTRKECCFIVCKYYLWYSLPAINHS